MIKMLCEQKSEAWYAARSGRVTGTSFADLMAAKTTAAYRNLIADIAADIINPDLESEESYTNAAMLRGIELEPEARKMYAEMNEIEVEQVGFIIPDEDNKYHEWIGVSPDGLPGSGLIEIKCPNKSTHLYYIQKNVLPSEYRHQVQGQLFVTGLEFCDFISYYPGLKPFIIRVLPDKELFTKFELELDILIKEVKILMSSYIEYPLSFTKESLK
jgi:putative phage-type endonuclease